MRCGYFSVVKAMNMQMVLLSKPVIFDIKKYNQFFDLKKMLPFIYLPVVSFAKFGAEFSHGVRLMVFLWADELLGKKLVVLLLEPLPALALVAFDGFMLRIFLGHVLIGF